MLPRSVGRVFLRLIEQPGIDKFLSTGEGGAMVDRGDNTYGGKYVINPSGGLESKGHPLGATGNSRVKRPLDRQSAPAYAYIYSLLTVGRSGAVCRTVLAVERSG